MLARCRVHEVSQEWGCEWGSSYMNESIHSVSSHDCRFLPNRMRGGSLVITHLEPVGMEAAAERSGLKREDVLVVSDERRRRAHAPSRKEYRQAPANPGFFGSCKYAASARA